MVSLPRSQCFSTMSTFGHASLAIKAHIFLELWFFLSTRNLWLSFILNYVSGQNGPITIKSTRKAYALTFTFHPMMNSATSTLTCTTCALIMHKGSIVVKFANKFISELETSSQYKLAYLLGNHSSLVYCCHRQMLPVHKQQKFAATDI